MTYFWIFTRPLVREEADAVRRDMVRIVTGAPFPLANGLGEPGTSPITEDGSLWFNGVVPDDHETFWWPADIEARDRAFPDPVTGEPREAPTYFGAGPGSGAALKVYSEPYGIAVRACFLVAKHLLGDAILIWDDLMWEADHLAVVEGWLDRQSEAASEWADVWTLFRTVFGFDPPPPWQPSDGEIWDRVFGK